MIITIDWYTWTGKGTTAKWVAEVLWYTYLDTGAMYRAATLYAINNNLLDAWDKVLSEIPGQVNIEFREVAGKQHCFLDGTDVEKEIRSTDLALQMKPIVTCIPLREAMITLQQSFWSQGNIVIDARDAGTHIFPDAELKVFMTCDVETRVTRRIKQLTEQWLEADESKIREETILRDQTDYLWPNAVNAKAPDAKELDTTHMTIDEQIQQVVMRAKSTK